MSAERAEPRDRRGADEGQRALALLGRLKFRGALRRQTRRLREPKGCLFAGLGLALLGLWLGAAGLHFLFGNRGDTSVEALLPSELLAKGLLLVFFATAALGGLAFGGLYLPKEDIERLFSAPVTRRALLAYRLRVAFLRSMGGAAIFGLLFAHRLASPAAAMLGVVLAIAALVLLQQSAALAAGLLARYLPLGWMRAALPILAGVVGGATVLLFSGGGQDWEGGLAGVRAALEGPLGRALLSPAAPFAGVLLAPDLAAAAPLGLAVALALGLWYRALLAWKVDFRELALDTSAAVAEQQRRMQSGRWWGAAKRAGKGALPRAPWWAGRGPLGAVVWFKSAGFLRRSRGSLWLSAAVPVVLVALGWLIARLDGDPPDLPTVGMLVVLGSLFFCGLLRLDFREEFERLEQLKSFPLSPRALFAAVLLPQWLMGSLALAGVVLTFALGGAQRPELLLALAALLPLGLGLWLAIDNAFFLLWPVRMRPAAGGTLHHVGRSAILMALRAAALGAAVLVAVTGSFGAAALADWAGASRAVAFAAGSAGALAPLLVALALAWHLGARALAAVDPSRDWA